jgi:hypothetical protein
MGFWTSLVGITEGLVRKKKTLRPRSSALKLLVVCALVIYPSLSFSMNPSAELNDTEVAKLGHKELITHSKKLSGYPWPEITVFALIEATPLEAAALFSNYQDCTQYIPDMIKSVPSRRVADNEVIVDFEMRLPWPLTKSKYSTGNIFSRLGDNEYQVCWYLVESDSFIDTKGTVQFIPYGNKTLLRYQSLIYPESKMASFFSSRARSGVCKTVQAIVSYVEQTKGKDPEKTQKLSSALLRANRLDQRTAAVDSAYRAGNQ